MVEQLEVDVAVVGGGPAGIAAACRAAESGARVVLIEEAAGAGGPLWRRRGKLPRIARRWFDRLARSGAELRTSTLVFDALSDRTVLAEAEGAPLRIATRCLVLATGARERFVPFPGWTLPNVLGVGGAQALLKAGGEFRGKTVVVAGSGPLLLPAAAAIADGGGRIAVVAEQAPARQVNAFALSLWRQPAKLATAAAYRAAFARARYRSGVWVSAASGTGRVEEAQLTDGVRSWTVRCDVLACGYGLVPNLELARRLRCVTSDDRVVVDAAQRTSAPGVFCAGEPTGVGGYDLALVEGQIAGLAACGRERETSALLARRRRLQRFASALEGAFALRTELRDLPQPDTLVCRCEDVPYSLLAGEWHLRQAKLGLRVGMGACQGRVCGPAIAFLLGWDPDSVRPPLKPVRVATLAALYGIGTGAPVGPSTGDHR